MRDAAIDAASRLGVFEWLRTPSTPEALAAARGLDGTWLAWLLAGLAGEGLLARDGARYRVTSPRDVIRSAAGGALLADVIARRRPLAWSEIAGNPDAAALTVLVDAPGEAVTAELARELVPALAAGGQLVDVGCGSGALAAAMLLAAPLATALLVDRPHVLATAASRLARFGARVELQAADIVSFPVPPCRAALLAQVLHLIPPDDANALVLRSARALAPGGVLAVVEVDVEHASDAPAMAAWFALSLLVHGLPGLVARSRIETWFADAGLVDIAAHPVPARPGVVVVTGRTPPSPLFAD